MDDLEKFNETSLREKEDVYNYINMECITYENCAYAKKFIKMFKYKI